MRKSLEVRFSTSFVYSQNDVSESCSTKQDRKKQQHEYTQCIYSKTHRLDKSWKYENNYDKNAWWQHQNQQISTRLRDERKRKISLIETWIFENENNEEEKLCYDSRNRYSAYILMRKIKHVWTFINKREKIRIRNMSWCSKCSKTWATWAKLLMMLEDMSNTSSAQNARENERHEQRIFLII